MLWTTLTVLQLSHGATLHALHHTATSYEDSRTLMYTYIDDELCMQITFLHNVAKRQWSIWIEEHVKVVLFIL